MFPDRAVLYMALAETPWITKYEESAFTFWISLTHVYDLDMSILAEKAVEKYQGKKKIPYSLLVSNLIISHRYCSCSYGSSRRCYEQSQGHM